MLLSNVQAQATLLHQIAAKLDINASGLVGGAAPPSVHVDGIGANIQQPSTADASMSYESTSLGLGIERNRARSVRIRQSDMSGPRSERPRSTII